MEVGALVGMAADKAMAALFWCDGTPTWAMAAMAGAGCTLAAVRRRSRTQFLVGAMLVTVVVWAPDVFITMAGG